MSRTRTCAVRDCQRRHYARGWCRIHYERWRRCGRPMADVPTKRRLASSGAWVPAHPLQELAAAYSMRELGRLYAERFGYVTPAGERAAYRLRSASRLKTDTADRWCVVLEEHLSMVYPQLYPELLEETA